MDNTSLLSRGSKVYAAKRAAKKALIPEISFDEDARRDYLTGFHTRKVARKVASVKAAKEKERLQRIEDRKERREAAAEALSDKMAEYKRLMGNGPFWCICYLP
jgi:ribosomal RNA-processing protein 17